MNTLKKTLELIDFIVKSPEGLTVSEIARKFNMSISNTYKYLTILEESGYLIRNSEKKYKPGFKLVEYGSIILRKIDLREIAHPYIVDLAKKTGETIHLILKENQVGIYIDKIEGFNSLPMISRIGMKVDLYCTSSGKAILAFLPGEELNRYLNSVKLIPKTPHTIIDKKKLLTELNKIKKEGFAVDNEENEIGIKCVAVPIFNHIGYPIAAISITGPAQRMTEEKISFFVPILKEASIYISHKLGFRDLGGGAW